MARGVIIRAFLISKKEAPRPEGRALECLWPVHLHFQLEKWISGFVYKPERKYQLIIAGKRKKLYRNSHAVPGAQDMAWGGDLLCAGADIHAALIGLERAGWSHTEFRTAKRR